MRKNRKLVAIIFASIAVLLAGLICFQKVYFAAPKGYHKINAYIPPTSGTVQCNALLPECGWCPGIVNHDNCYVKNSYDPRHPY